MPKRSAWLTHVMKTKAMPKHKGKAFKTILKEASKTWKKGSQ